MYWMKHQWLFLLKELEIDSQWQCFYTAAVNALIRLFVKSSLLQSEKKIISERYGVRTSEKSCGEKRGLHPMLPHELSDKLDSICNKFVFLPVIFDKIQAFFIIFWLCASHGLLELFLFLHTVSDFFA